VYQVATDYLLGLSFGMPAFVLYAVLRPYSEGISFTRAHMVSALLGLAVNIPANYVLIFGEFGFPKLGGAGCGWATALSFWVMFAVMFFYTRRASAYKMASLYQYRFKIHRPDIQLLFAIGLPIAFTILVEVSIFAFITLFLGGLESHLIAGHQVAMNVAFMLYIFPWSVSIAASIRVGVSLGAGDRVAARRVGIVSMGVTVTAALLTSLLLLSQPHAIASLYTADPLVIAQAVSLLFFAALFQLSDAVVTPLQGVLRGYHDTRVSLVLNILAYWLIALPLGYVLGLTDWVFPMMGAQGYWISLVVGLTVAGLLLLPRFLMVSRVTAGKGAMMEA